MLPLLRPILRTAPIHHTARQFHASIPRPFLEITVPALTTLHSASGLQWCTFIPLSAILLRSTITFPFALKAQLNRRTLVALSPLLQSWAHIVRRRESAVATNTPATWEKQTSTMIRLKTREIRKRHGAQLWKLNLQLLQVPVWIIASMSLRVVSGKNVFSWLPGAPTYSPSPATGIPTAEVAGVMVPDPTLFNEGWAFCVDLAAADPTHVLPAAFAALLFLNAGLHARKIGEMSARQKAMSGLVTGLAVCALPITFSQPAALTLYWTTSAGFSVVQTLMLMKIWPEGEAVKGIRLRRVVEDRMETLEKKKRWWSA